MDQGDIDWLGLYHNNGSKFFERYSNVIRFIMKQNGHNALFNYIDDLIYVGLP